MAVKLFVFHFRKRCSINEKQKKILLSEKKFV
jgi:hypothetical protein